MVLFILYFLVGTCSAFSWPPERLRVEKVGSFARREVDGQEPVPSFNSVKGLIRTQKLYTKVQTLSPVNPSLFCHQNFTPLVAPLHFLRH